MPQYTCILNENGKLPPDFARSLTNKLKELAGKQIFISVAEIKQPDKEIIEYIEKSKTNPPTASM